MLLRFPHYDILFDNKEYLKDFPGSPVVKNLPSNAGDSGSIPGWGTKIPHAVGQPSPRATTTEACVLWSLRATTGDKPVYHNQRAVRRC